MLITISFEVLDCTVGPIVYGATSFESAQQVFAALSSHWHGDEVHVTIQVEGLSVGAQAQLEADSVDLTYWFNTDLRALLNLKGGG